MPGEARRWQLDGGDQFVDGQAVVALGRVCRQAMEVGEGDPPLASAAAHPYLSLQRRQRHAQVGWMYRHAVFAGAEDRMVAVQPAARGASAARLALVAWRVGVVEILAAGTLQQVAAGAGHVAQLRRGAGEDRLGEQGIVRLHGGIPGQFGVADQGPDQQAAGGRPADAQRQAGDVDESPGPGNVFLHQVEQVGAAGDVARLRAGEAQRLLDVGRLGIGEGRHARCPPCPSRSNSGKASSTASRILP